MPVASPFGDIWELVPLSGPPINPMGVPPAITCPADITVNCEDDRSSANTGVATATDNCDNDVTITESDSVASGSCPQEEVITRTWTGTDDCGNASSCDQIVTVIDDEAPAITCPDNITVNCVPGAGAGENCFSDFLTNVLTVSPETTGTATATDNCDTDVDISFSDSTEAGTCPQEKVITRTWTAVDDCNNSSECDQVITVVDDEAPSITCPSDITVECIADITQAGCLADLLDTASNTDPNVTGVATATDNCDPNPVISHSSDIAAGSCPQEKVITRTWTATDDCGNASNCAQIVTVVDDTAPVMTCPDDITVNCEEDVILPTVTATDNCDNDVTIVFEASTAAGTCPQEEVITRTWTAEDDCGNSLSCGQIVSVVDDEAPEITCPNDITVECTPDAGSAACLDDLLTSAFNTDPAVTSIATATDNCDNDIDIVFSDSIEAGSCPQEKTVTRTWSATDDCGNQSSCAQTITVVDTTVPVVTCPIDVTIQCDASSNPSNTGEATASDNCDLEVDIAYSDAVSSGSCPEENTITRTWTGTDDCGNIGSCDQVVTIVDTSAPEITCPDDITVQCTPDVESSTDSSCTTALVTALKNTSPAETGSATATDNCDADPAISFSDSSVDGSCPQEEVITRTWTATDNCGNSSTCDQAITVVDDEAPAITCPDDVTIECVPDIDTADCLGDILGISENTDPANAGNATATDNCDNAPAVTFNDSIALGSCPQERTVTRTWTGTDDCGNASSCVQVVTVVDSTAPQITCPADVTVNCEDDRTSANTGAATATDNCDNDVTIAESDSVAAGSCPQEEVITRTWTGTDDCGNASSCDQIVSVVDDENPAITCPADVTVNCEDDRTSANTGVATATDNCDNEIDIVESDSVAAGTCPQEEVITRTWTGTDDCGNASSCNQAVTVVDNEAPVITCPADATVNCSPAPGNADCFGDVLSAIISTDSSVTGSATASDNCDNDIDIGFSRQFGAKAGEMRTTGSIAYELAMTACGVLQYSLFGFPRIWDMAGGALAVMEAKGTVMTRFRGEKRWHPLESLVPTWEANPPSLKELRQWVAPLVAGNRQVAPMVAANIHPRFRPLAKLRRVARRLRPGQNH